MPTRNINLTDHLDQFVESGIDSGRYSNASEMVREGLRLLEAREQEQAAKIEWIRSAALEGFAQIERGEYIALETDEEIDAFVREIRLGVQARG